MKTETARLRQQPFAPSETGALSVEVPRLSSRITALLAAMPARVAIYDFAGTASYFNQSWLDYTGWTGAEDGPSPVLTSLVHPDEREVASRALAEARDAPTFEARLRHRSGAYFWHLVRLVTVAGSDGDADEYVMAAIDIQAMKDLEAAREARIADQDAFLGLLAHEIRSPLATVSGYTDLLQRRGVDLSQREHAEALAQVAAGGARLERILGNMLTLARLTNESGEALEPVLLQHVAATIVDRFRTDFPGLSIVVDAESGTPAVLADSAGIEQVLWNFLTNAAKYGGAGGQVEVCVRSRSGSVELTVQDGGEGIPGDEITRLFEPFFRARAARQRAPGLGLGLAVCKRIVEAYGGNIFARPRAVGGMLFGFTLPSVAEEKADAPPS